MRAVERDRCIDHVGRVDRSHGNAETRREQRRQEFRRVQRGPAREEDDLIRTIRPNECCDETPPHRLSSIGVHDATNRSRDVEELRLHDMGEPVRRRSLRARIELVLLARDLGLIRTEEIGPRSEGCVRLRHSHEHVRR